MDVSGKGEGWVKFLPCLVQPLPEVNPIVRTDWPEAMTSI